VCFSRILPALKSSQRQECYYHLQKYRPAPSAQDLPEPSEARKVKYCRHLLFEVEPNADTAAVIDLTATSKLWSLQDVGGYRASLHLESSNFWLLTLGSSERSPSICHDLRHRCLREEKEFNAYRPLGREYRRYEMRKMSRCKGGNAGSAD